MNEQKFIEEYVKYESSLVLPGSKLIGMNGDHFVIEYKNQKIFIFQTYDDAQKFVDNTIKKYFDSNHQQLIYMYKHFVDEISWKDFVNWKKVLNHIVSNYDDMIGNSFKDENKEAVLEEIKKDIKSFLISTGVDDGVLSNFLFPFFDLVSIEQEIADGMEFRVYEHGSYFYVPIIELP